jgi:hypothetical protein
MNCVSSSKNSSLHQELNDTLLAAMKVASANNVKVYTVSGEAVRTLPDWLIRQKKRALRDDPG